MTSENYPEDLHLGRGWLNRAAEMLDSCEDHVSDAEFARAAAAIGSGFIRLAAAEREAAAQAFVDGRHAAERAEDLERIAANRAEDLERIAAADAKAWEHQDSEAEVREAVVEAHRAMTARMQAEQAELEQRTEALAAIDVAALAASGQREKRAKAEARPPAGDPAHPFPYISEMAEARPHDDEPKPPPCTGCFGPFSDGTHGPGCTQRCQDCHGAPDGPGACHCRSGGLADRLIAIANAVYGNDTRHVLDAPTGHGLAAVVRALADGPLIQTEWAAAQFRKLAFELETAGEATDRG